MKKIAILFFIGAFVTNINAQSNAITKHFTDYQRDANFSKMTISNRMFSMFIDIEGEDVNEEEIYEALSKIKGIKAIKHNKTENNKKLYIDALATIAKDGSYEELILVEDAEENLQFLVKDEGGKIAELLVILGGNNTFAVMSVYGEIDLNMLVKVSKSMNIKGMEAFQALEKN